MALSIWAAGSANWPEYGMMSPILTVGSACAGATPKSAAARASAIRVVRMDVLTGTSSGVMARAILRRLTTRRASRGTTSCYTGAAGIGVEGGTTERDGYPRREGDRDGAPRARPGRAARHRRDRRGGRPEWPHARTGSDGPRSSHHGGDRPEQGLHGGKLPATHERAGGRGRAELVSKPGGVEQWPHHAGGGCVAHRGGRECRGGDRRGGRHGGAGPALRR